MEIYNKIRRERESKSLSRIVLDERMGPSRREMKNKRRKNETQTVQDVLMVVERVKVGTDMVCWLQRYPTEINIYIYIYILWM